MTGSVFPSSKPPEEHKHERLHASFFVGSVAGVAGDFAMHPLDTVKTRLQVQAAIVQNRQTQPQAPRYRGVFDGIRRIMAEEGLKGFYKGGSATVAGAASSMAIHFGTYEWMKTLGEGYRGDHPRMVHMAAGATGELFGSVTYVPFEVVKQRMQSQRSGRGLAYGSSTQHYYHGSWHALRSVYGAQGMRGLYTGYWSTLARDIPFAGIQFMLYEELKALSARSLGVPISSIEATPYCCFFVGGLAGAISGVVTTPLDCVKTRLQVQGHGINAVHTGGVLSTLWQMAVSGGISSLMCGATPRGVWYLCQSAIQFMVYESIISRSGHLFA
eukprot:jgi/Mesvir1/13483/Mv16534-RA.1